MIGDDLEFLCLGQRGVEELEVGKNVWVGGADRNDIRSTGGLRLRNGGGESSSSGRRVGHRGSRGAVRNQSSDPERGRAESRRRIQKQKLIY